VVVRHAVVVTVLACAIDAAGVTAGQSPAARGPSVWDGVYSEAQARRGAAVYEAPCGKCHGYRLNGAPDDPDMISTQPIAGPKFLRDWDGVSLAALYAYTRATMPANNPGFLSDGEYADLLAYMLFVSGAPAGENELSSDPGRLTGIVIRQQR
jgi:mono/diheme cytochrome c family protein